MSAPPVGREAGQDLELLPAEAVDDPARIARSVVGMLNAKAGEVWIGIGQAAERASRIELSPSAAEARLIEEELRDSIEPRPGKDEIAVEMIEAGGAPVLKVTVGESRHRPFAVLDREAREYLVRVGPLVRALTREELRAAFATSKSHADGPASRLRARREQARLRREPALWLRFEPEPELALDLESSRLRELLSDPERSGNRPEGWHVINPFREARLHTDHLEIGDGAGVEARVERGGALELSITLERLRWKGDPRELWPSTLAGYAVSSARLATRIWEVFGPPTRGLADLTLVEARGDRLDPRRLEGLGGGNAKTWEDGDDMIWARPLEASFEKLKGDPDRLGARLVTRVYEAFGFRRRDIPPDLRRMRLRLWSR